MINDSIIHGYRHQDDQAEEQLFLAGSPDLVLLDHDLDCDCVVKVRPNPERVTVWSAVRLAAVWLAFFFAGLGMGEYESHVRLGRVMDEMAVGMGAEVANRDMTIAQLYSECVRRGQWIKQAERHIRGLEDQLEKFYKVNYAMRLD